MSRKSVKEVTLMSVISNEIEALFGNTTKAQAAMLLGKNISAAVVSNILGVSKSLISQYFEDSTFKEAVGLMQIEATLSASLHDEKINALEDRALEKLEQVMEYVTKPM
jgi:predicted transcriptional regulator